MEANTFTAEVDKTQIPPINPDRILAFVNHFLMNTCDFLNEFVRNCETKLVQMERKLQRTEAALVILEAKLASIPIENEPANPNLSQGSTEAKLNDEINKSEVEALAEEVKGVRVCEDAQYKKFFRMLHLGIPAPAIKIKMQSDGLKPELLDNPDFVLENETPPL